MVQVPTDSNMADLNAKLIGYWRSEDQVRVGEYENGNLKKRRILQERSARLQRCL